MIKSVKKLKLWIFRSHYWLTYFKINTSKNHWKCLQCPCLNESRSLHLINVVTWKSWNRWLDLFFFNFVFHKGKNKEYSHMQIFCLLNVRFYELKPLFELTKLLKPVFHSTSRSLIYFFITLKENCVIHYVKNNTCSNKWFLQVWRIHYQGVYQR